MGASAKTLSRILSLHQRGLVPSGAAVIDLGTQQLFCSGQIQAIEEIIRHFAATDAAVRKLEAYSAAQLNDFADKGLLGDLLIACGFAYCALDIFEASHTTLFDLNVQSVDDEMRERFDLVTNLGTTEHIINQYQAMKSMHELARVGGLIYHDLPLAGYHTHGYFSYNPLFFQHLAVANGYDIIMHHYSRGAKLAPAPEFMVENGFPGDGYFDFGIEFILRKNSSAPFRMPLETSTSMDAPAASLGANPYVHDALRDGDADFLRTGSYLSMVSGRELLKELFLRYRRRLLRKFTRR